MIVQHIPEYLFNNTSEGIVNAQEDKTTPKLEALVRESIQNSLDASDGSENVVVEFGYGKFDIDRLSSIIPDSEPIFRSQSDLCLYVKDSGTVGLTGAVDDKKQNYCSLVKKIGQTGKDAGSMGGSWGKGKSVFYRQGIGFVIFYSRIRNDDGSFESRMNAVFANWRDIEYHPIDNWTGISIWGGEEYKGYDITPIYDESAIHEVLNSFDITPYDGQETGTVVIMPSVSDEDLLIDVEDGVEHDTEKTWLTSVVRCIDFYIQKWFSSRLNNKVEGKPTLCCSVNGVPVSLKYNLFLRFQELYNDAFDDSKKNVIKLPYKKQNRSYGNLAWKIYSDSDLADSVIRDPYKLCGIRSVSEKGNRPIVTYLRSPGLFLTFEEPSFNNLPEVESGSYLLAVFRLNSDEDTVVILKNKKAVSLEQYIRSTERSNHMGWRDTSAASDNCVTNIMRQISGKLSEQMKSGSITRVSGRRSTDGRFVAEKLFPESGSYLRFRRERNKSITEKKTHKTSKKPDVYLREVSEKQTVEGVLENVELRFVNTRIAHIRLGAFAESVTYYRESWEKDIGTNFPISFMSAVVQSYTEDDGREVTCDVRTDPDFYRATGDRFTIRWLTPSEIQINSGRTNTTMKMELLIRRPEGTMIVPEISISVKREEDE